LIPFRIFAKKTLGHIGTFSDFEAERAKNDANNKKHIKGTVAPD
jgi:hypothetical protein